MSIYIYTHTEIFVYPFIHMFMYMSMCLHVYTYAPQIPVSTPLRCALYIYVPYPAMHVLYSYL